MLEKEEFFLSLQRAVIDYQEGTDFDDNSMVSLLLGLVISYSDTHNFDRESLARLILIPPKYPTKFGESK